MNPDGTLDEPDVSSFTLAVCFIFVVIAALMVLVIQLIWWHQASQILSIGYSCCFVCCAVVEKAFFFHRKKLPMVVSKFPNQRAEKHRGEELGVHHMRDPVCTTLLCWGVSCTARQPTLSIITVSSKPVLRIYVKFSKKMLLERARLSDGLEQLLSIFRQNLDRSQSLCVISDDIAMSLMGVKLLALWRNIDQSLRDRGVIILKHSLYT